MVRIHRAAVSIAAVSIAGAAVFAALPSASASASVGQECGDGHSGGNIRTCLTIDNGRKVEGTARVLGQGRSLSVCIRHAGHSDGCTGFKFVPKGQDIGIALYEINHNLGKGVYCARTYRLNPDGGNTMIAQECLNWIS